VKVNPRSEIGRFGLILRVGGTGVYFGLFSGQSVGLGCRPGATPAWLCEEFI